MCEVCRSEGQNYVFKNGSKPLYNDALYRVFKDNVANIKLCHIHSIELFKLGETRFLKEHILFARTLAKKVPKISLEADAPSFNF
jgi:hypothetical protein